MAFKSLLIISLIIAVASEEKPEGKRLIKYLPGEPAKWMTTQELNQLIGDDKRMGYLDLTQKGVDSPPQPAGGRQLSIYKYPDHALYKDTIKKLFPKLKTNHIEEIVHKLSSFHSRNARMYYGSSEAEGWLTLELKKILADFKGVSSIRLISDQDQASENYIPHKQNNIIVRIDGQDNKKKEELVILGAHYDSIIGFNQEQYQSYEQTRSPGADDNAAGVAVLMEILRLLIQSGTKLKYTVEFHFYTAKEIGLGGSIDIVGQYILKNAKVKGMLNLDRVGYGTVMGIIARNPNNGKWETSETLTKFVVMLVNEYSEHRGLLKEVDCLGNCYSDHFPWHDSGYPSAYIAEYELNPNIHTERDTHKFINFKLVNEFAKVATAFAVELGEPSSGWKLQLEWNVIGISLVGIWSLF